MVRATGGPRVAPAALTTQRQAPHGRTLSQNVGGRAGASPRHGVGVARCPSECEKQLSCDNVADDTGPSEPHSARCIYCGVGVALSRAAKRRQALGRHHQRQGHSVLRRRPPSFARGVDSPRGLHVLVRPVRAGKRLPSVDFSSLHSERLSFRQGWTEDVARLLGRSGPGQICNHTWWELVRGAAARGGPELVRSTGQTNLLPQAAWQLSTLQNTLARSVCATRRHLCCPVTR